MIEVLIEIAGEILTTLAEILWALLWGRRKRKKQEKKRRDEQQRKADRQCPL